MLQVTWLPQARKKKGTTTPDSRAGVVTAESQFSLSLCQIPPLLRNKEVIERRLLGMLLEEECYTTLMISAEGNRISSIIISVINNGKYGHGIIAMRIQPLKYQRLISELRACVNLREEGQSI